MLRGMTDTRDTSTRIQPDTKVGPHARLTEAAYEHARTTFGGDGIDALSKKLGLANRMVLWRIRHGRYDIRHGQAMEIAERLGWDVADVFEGGRSA